MPSFEDSYPHVTRWIKEHGWIELGYDGWRRSLVRALDEGGLIWEGGDPAQTLDETLRELDVALAKSLREQFGR